jgi:hypothetical protein
MAEDSRPEQEDKGNFKVIDMETKAYGKRYTDENGLTYVQTKGGRVYDTIPTSRLRCGGFHTYNRKQKS